MTRLAALLRAVNVGGRKLLMDDLRRVAAELGFRETQTLLASGNLVFSTDLAPADAARALEAAILAGLGIAADVFVRGHDELAAIIAGNPFADAALSRPAALGVMFLSGPLSGALDDLQPACTAGERVAAGAGCLYIDYPHGMGTSKLTNSLIERRLGVRGTARNWNTVGRLRDLLA